MGSSTKAVFLRDRRWQIVIAGLLIQVVVMVMAIVQGARNNEIAQRLHIAVKTVETHLTSIYSKLGVQSRAEAIALAQRQGLLLENGAE